MMRQYSHLAPTIGYEWKMRRDFRERAFRKERVDGFRREVGQYLVGSECIKRRQVRNVNLMHSRLRQGPHLICCTHRANWIDIHHLQAGASCKTGDPGQRWREFVKQKNAAIARTKTHAFL